MTAVDDLRRDDSGMSLIELLVVMVILGIVGTMVATGVIRGFRASDQVQTRIDVMSELHLVSTRVSRDARAACPVVVAEPYRLQVVFERNDESLRATYEVPVGSQELHQTLEYWDDSLATPAFVQRWQGVMVDGLVNRDLTEPVFAYFASDGTVTSSAPSVNEIRTTFFNGVRDGDPISLSSVVDVRNNHDGAEPC